MNMLSERRNSANANNFEQMLLKEASSYIGVEGITKVDMEVNSDDDTVTLKLASDKLVSQFRIDMMTIRQCISPKFQIYYSIAQCFTAYLEAKQRYEGSTKS